MDDFEKLINASDLIEWIMETYPDWCVGDVRSIVDHVMDLPSAQPEILACGEGELNVPGTNVGDLISRQAAIDAIESAKTARTPDGEIYVAKLNAEMNIQILPSAQPEIIRCKDCKWKQGSECVRFAEVRPFPDDFCSRAERRTDEPDRQRSIDRRI